MTFIQLIRGDYRRYRLYGSDVMATLFLTQGFWASTVYRFQHHIRFHVRIPGVRQLLRVLGAAAHKAMEIVTGISLAPMMEAGEGLYIGHFGSIIVSAHAKLGRHCNLSQNVTIGTAGRGTQRGAPVLGDRVYVGPGSILLGPIHIGDDVAIGAGTVVTKSVPPRSVVVGNPARIISENGSYEFVRYDGCDVDPARVESCALRSSPNEASTRFARPSSKQLQTPRGEEGA